MNRNYFDYNSTTPIDPIVVKEMYDFMTNYFGNYNSYHENGFIIKKIIDKCIEKISSYINAYPEEIIFTSGATESNTLAIKGICDYYIEQNKNKNHIICSIMEHDSVINIVKQLSKTIFKIDYVYPDKYGIIHPEEINKLIIKDKTLLVICMHVNHEIGSINNIKEIGQLCFEKNVFLHVDAAQSYGKINIDVKDYKISTLSVSGHKIYCPKGIGFLYVSKKPIRIRLKPLQIGGGQQRGIRGGTIPSELIVALDKASSLCFENLNDESKKIYKLQNFINYKITYGLDKIKINGPLGINRINNNLNYSFYGVEGESIIMHLFDYCISTGSACRSENLEPSQSIFHVSGHDYAHSSIRVSFGRFTTFDQCELFIEKLIKTINKLREYSPLFH